MKVFQTILCPVDFSEFSILALRYAGAFRKEYESELIVYHAIHSVVQPLTHLDITASDQGDWISESRKELERLVSEILPGEPNIKVVVGIANPAVGIFDQAILNKADLIIMGTHGRTGFERYFMGSVTNKVLHHSQIPVLVVCHTSRHFFGNGSRPIRIKKILCPVDLKHHCHVIRKLGFDLARTYQSNIVFMHVVDPVIAYVGSEWERDAGLLEAQEMSLVQEERRRRHRHATLKLQHLLGSYDETWCTVHKLVTEGDPVEEILGIIEKHKIELVIMGHHTRMPLIEAVVGSVTQKIIARTSCPVLVVRFEK